MLRILSLNPANQIHKSDKRYFGGEFSFFERLRLDGIGSTKIIYENGIPYFDELQTIAPNEISFVNFELLRDGLLLRLNRNQRIRCVGVRISDLRQLHLEGFRIAIRSRKYGDNQTKIVQRGIFTLVTKEDNQVQLRVLLHDFDKILNFFDRQGFDNIFSYSTSLNNVEYIDNEEFIEVLEGIFRFF